MSEGAKSKTADQILADEAEAKTRADEVRRQLAADEARRKEQQQARKDEWDDEFLEAAKERSVELARRERDGWQRMRAALAELFAGWLDAQAARLVRWELVHRPGELPSGGVVGEAPTSGGLEWQRIQAYLDEEARARADEELEALRAERQTVVDGE